MSEMEEKKATDETGKLIPTRILHTKSPLFRVMQADGAWGSLNIFGLIHLSFFSERPALPTAITLIPSADKKSFTGMETENAELQNRDFEADVVMTLGAAKRIHTVLGNFIKIAEDEKRSKTGDEHANS